MKLDKQRRITIPNDFAEVVGLEAGKNYLCEEGGKIKILQETTEKDKIIAVVKIDAKYRVVFPKYVSDFMNLENDFRIFIQGNKIWIEEIKEGG